MTDEGRTFPVVEVFGPTMQGEGALAGVLTHFVRFGGCDYACQWCDSAHAVLVKHVREAEKLTARQISARIHALSPKPNWVTLSGGNPALHDLSELVDTLDDIDNYKIAIETQGTLWKPWIRDLDMITVSPKGPSSGMKTDFKLLDAFLTNIPHPTENSCLKIVCFDEYDLTYAEDIQRRYPQFPFYLSVGTMMGGLDGMFARGQIDTSDDILKRYRWLVERTIERGFRNVTILPQLHALVWGHSRGH